MIKVRKIIVALIALLVIFQPAMNSKGYAATSFKDIPAQYNTEIGYLIGKKILVGNGGSFRPKDGITREDAVVMVGRALGLSSKKQNTSFKDVTSKSAASGYIQSAYKKGLIKGYSNKTFKPKAKITKSDAAYMLAKAYALKQTSNLTFKDVSKSNSRYTVFNQIVTAGIINKANGSAFYPSASVSRQDFSVFLARGMNKSYRIPAVTPPNIAKTKPVGQYSVNATSLNVRQGPSTYYPAVGILKNAKKVTVYQIKNGWAYVTDGKLKGYASSQYLKLVKASNTVTTPPKEDPKPDPNQPDPNSPDSNNPDPNNPGSDDSANLPGQDDPDNPQGVTDPKPPVKQPTVDQRIVTADLNVRKGPGTSYAVLTVLKKNTKVTVLKESNGWANIEFGTLKGYVSTSYLKVVTSNQKIIVLDPGHGGKDPGASGNGIVEKEVTLSVAQRVQKLLEKNGIKVVMTRTGDTYPTLSERNDIAAKSGADAFISIHVNTAGAVTASGTETYYNSGGDKTRAAQSKQLASFVQDRLYKAMKTTNRGYKEQEFQVIKYNPLPSILVELGFLSNKDDAAKLKSDQYRDTAAQAIYQGILDFYKYIGK
ncbi:N-acetylmuramoyl-L-alanine amidase [Bacillus sp. FJAT-49736]|uniref:N-acetylmuramoyl-L-alanine amidase n=1 Tax=Bacillus sp. FJAT-49736 TaxID=2833582 RepID=UPI001BC9FF1F|nr:N-acetylmuramoyl-L-alanine amidase [Bacillus sp. FJAT-49736]MBS4174328.1 N-acetylmuramoyl-L-alanine amidase [Bacillus sp. FJAT-49736]